MSSTRPNRLLLATPCPPPYNGQIKRAGSYTQLAPQAHEVDDKSRTRHRSTSQTRQTAERQSYQAMAGAQYQLEPEGTESRARHRSTSQTRQLAGAQDHDSLMAPWQAVVKLSWPSLPSVQQLLCPAIFLAAAVSIVIALAVPSFVAHFIYSIMKSIVCDAERSDILFYLCCE